MLIRVGPVASSAALAWTRHLLANLELVRARTELLPFQLPDDIAVAFSELLTEWQHVAERADPFVWEADLDAAAVRHLVQYWANLDSLTPELLQKLGLEWSPPRARPFFAALAHGVAEAFEREGESDAFAALLATRADAQAG